MDSSEERVGALEKKVAALEKTLQKQQQIQVEEIIDLIVRRLADSIAGGIRTST